MIHVSFDAGDPTGRYEPGSATPESDPGETDGEYDPYPARLREWVATRLPGRTPGE